MTKKHFQMIADVLYYCNQTGKISNDKFGDVIMLFSSELQRTNPKFDKVRFYKAATKTG